MAKPSERILHKFDDLKDTAENNMLVDFNELEQTLYEELRQLLLMQTVTGGKFVTDQKALERLFGIDGIVERAFASSGYTARVQDYISNFDQMNKLIKETQGEINSITIPDSLIKPAQKYFTQVTLDNLKGLKIDANFTAPLREALYKQIAMGGTIQDAETILKNFIQSDAEKLSYLQRYVGQVARDALSQYEGMINQQIALEFEMTNRYYIGSLIKDSRAQCRKWVAMGILSDEDVAHEIEWCTGGETGGPGEYEGLICSGFMPDTTVETFNINRGGYNCRHDCVPTLNEI